MKHQRQALKAFGIVLLLILSVQVFGQAMGFNYQAVARRANGDLIANTNLDVSISLYSSDYKLLWRESHGVSTDKYGLFNLVICNSDSWRTGGSHLSLSDIDWSEEMISIGVEIDDGGGIVDLGIRPLQAVPYALFSLSDKNQNAWNKEDNNLVYVNGNVGIGTLNPEGRFSIQGVDEGEEEPLFMVTRKDGYPVFAVYEHGVYAYTDTVASAKGYKGGFAVGGYKKAIKGIGQEYMRITPDSIRFYVEEDDPDTKGYKGGFAVGGYKKKAKSSDYELLRVTPDSVRIYINDDPNGKGIKSGFAVGGYKKSVKGPKSEFLRVTTDSTRVFVRDSVAGFGVGSLYDESAKSFLNLSTENYFIGHESGLKNQSGKYNAFLGYHSGLSNTIGMNNVFIGHSSGLNSKDGSGNIFIGFKSGHKLIHGDNNTYLGCQAGYNSTESVANTFVGYQAGFLSIENGYNTCVGYRAGASDDGGKNVFLGYESGLNNDYGYSRYESVAIGYRAGYTGDGDYNVFIGSEAGKNTGGERNTIIGYRAASNNRSDRNVILGAESSLNLSTGTDNITIGDKSGYSNSTGKSNLYFGTNSGYHSTGGSNNVCIGESSGLYNSGNNNVFLGHRAGEENGGSNNIFLGAYSGMTLSGNYQLMIDMTEATKEEAFIWGDMYNDILTLNADVGVGTTSPDAPLHIVTSNSNIGSIRVESQYNGSSSHYGGVFIAENGTRGTGVYANGGFVDFYAAGAGTNYSPFTGSHEAVLAESFPREILPGMLVSLTGKVERRSKEDGSTSISSTMPEICLSTTENDKAIFGVFVSEAPLPENHWLQKQVRAATVNALGEGRVWVCESNGAIEAGDYITSSKVPGYGQKQDDDLLHNYTLGKATETIDWDTVNETITIDGQQVKVYLIGVVYVSG